MCDAGTGESETDSPVARMSVAAGGMHYLSPYTVVTSSRYFSTIYSMWSIKSPNQIGFNGRIFMICRIRDHSGRVSAQHYVTLIWCFKKQGSKYSEKNMVQVMDFQFLSFNFFIWNVKCFHFFKMATTHFRTTSESNLSSSSSGYSSMASPGPSRSGSSNPLCCLSESEDNTSGTPTKTNALFFNRQHHGLAVSTGGKKFSRILLLFDLIFKRRLPQLNGYFGGSHKTVIIITRCNL